MGSHNLLGPAGAAALAKVLKGLPHLEELRVGYAEKGRRRGRTLCTCMPSAVHVHDRSGARALVTQTRW